MNPHLELSTKIRRWWISLVSHQMIRHALFFYNYNKADDNQSDEPEQAPSAA